MIRVSRPAAVPKTLSSSKVAEALTTVEHTREFPSYWNKKDVRTSLWAGQHKKCCYCERARDLQRESDIDHFRPKSIYWWLAYDWHNLLFTCRCCNQEYKKDAFPVPDEARRATGPGADLDAEECLLLNPSVEDPEVHFSWDWVSCSDPNPSGIQLAMARPSTPRAEVTRNLLGLNRLDLAEERFGVVMTIESIETIYRCGEHTGNKDLREQALRRLREELAPEREFLALRRFCARSYPPWREAVENIIRSHI